MLRTNPKAQIMSGTWNVSHIRWGKRTTGLTYLCAILSWSACLRQWMGGVRRELGQVKAGECTVLVRVTEGPDLDTPAYQLRMFPPHSQLWADNHFPGLQFSLWCFEHCQRNCRAMTASGEWFHPTLYTQAATTHVHVLLPFSLMGKAAGRGY